VDKRLRQYAEDLSNFGKDKDKQEEEQGCDGCDDCGAC